MNFEFELSGMWILDEKFILNKRKLLKLARKVEKRKEEWYLYVFSTGVKENSTDFPLNIPEQQIFPKNH